jgi:hypothetical protein
MTKCLFSLWTWLLMKRSKRHGFIEEDPCRIMAASVILSINVGSLFLRGNWCFPELHPRTKAKSKKYRISTVLPVSISSSPTIRRFPMAVKLPVLSLARYPARICTPIPVFPVNFSRRRETHVNGRFVFRFALHAVTGGKEPNMGRPQFSLKIFLLFFVRDSLKNCRFLILLCFSILISVLVSLFRWDAAFSEDQITKTTTPTYKIVIHVAERKLLLYEQSGQGGTRLRQEYDVATAIKGLIPQPKGEGRITKIEFNPRWYPPPVTREMFKEKGIDLPSVVPPHHPLNFMGAFKIHLSHCTTRGCFYRIHGNNDKSKIGKRVTGGCVRMDNEEGTAMARLVRVGTKVIFEP